MCAAALAKPQYEADVYMRVSFRRPSCELKRGLASSPLVQSPTSRRKTSWAVLFMSR